MYDPLVGIVHDQRFRKRERLQSHMLSHNLAQDGISEYLEESLAHAGVIATGGDRIHFADVMEERPSVNQIDIDVCAIF
jgi:hypothetical protein